MRRDGVALKKMPNGRILALPGVTEASALDVSIPGLSVYVADGGQGSVDVLNLSGSRSRQGLTPAGQILKLTVGIVYFFQGNKQVLKFWSNFINIITMHVFRFSGFLSLILIIDAAQLENNIVVLTVIDKVALHVWCHDSQYFLVSRCPPQG